MNLEKVKVNPLDELWRIDRELVEKGSIYPITGTLDDLHTFKILYNDQSEVFEDPIYLGVIGKISESRDRSFSNLNELLETKGIESLPHNSYQSHYNEWFNSYLSDIEIIDQILDNDGTINRDRYILESASGAIDKFITQEKSGEQIERNGTGYDGIYSVRKGVIELIKKGKQDLFPEIKDKYEMLKEYE